MTALRLFTTRTRLRALVRVQPARARALVPVPALSLTVPLTQMSAGIMLAHASRSFYTNAVPHKESILHRPSQDDDRLDSLKKTAAGRCDALGYVLYSSPSSLASKPRNSKKPMSMLGGHSGEWPQPTLDPPGNAPMPDVIHL